MSESDSDADKNNAAENMEDDNNVLFCRSRNEKDQNDIWDDSALIKAYDKAVNLAKQEVCKRMGLDSSELSTNPTGTKSKEKAKSNKNQMIWSVGSPCRCVYSEDGKIYEAIIIKMCDSKTCIVKYIGYENIEKVELALLMKSEGLASQIAQQKEASTVEENSNDLQFNQSQASFAQNGYQDNSMNYVTKGPKSFKNTYNPGHSFDPHYGTIPPAPPLPPHLIARLPENDAEALSSMLMSWYMSGFHTGYYHGMKQTQNNQGYRPK